MMKRLRYCLAYLASVLVASVMAQSQHFHANIQNEAVNRYMTEVTYVLICQILFSYKYLIYS